MTAIPWQAPESGYVLAVGIYPEAGAALTDLRDLTNPGPTAEAIAGAGVLTRGPEGARLAQGGGGSTAYGIGTGAAIGLAVGHWVPMPLVGALAGAAIGGPIGRRLTSREAAVFGQHPRRGPAGRVRRPGLRRSRGASGRGSRRDGPCQQDDGQAPA